MKLQFLNNARGLAILMVVLVHAISVIPARTGFLRGVSLAFCDCTLLFVMIAGYLFVALSGGYRYGVFLKNKLQTVVAPYIMTSLPAAVIYIFGLKTTHIWMDMKWFNQLDVVQKYLYLIVTGAHLGPLWFMPMIVLYYIASPLWILLLRRGGLTVAFILALAVGIYAGRPVYNNNVLHSCIFFMPAWLLGMIAAVHPAVYTWLGKWAKPLLAGLMLSLFAYNAFFSMSSHESLVFKLALSVAFIGLCYQRLNHKIKVLDLLARLSFYLFFVHGYVVGAARMVALRLVWPDELIFLFTFILSLLLPLIGYVLLKPLLGRYSKTVIGA